MPMPTYRNVNYTPLYLLLAIGATCGMLITGHFFIEPAFHKIMADMVLEDYEKEYQEVQHPIGTEHLVQKATMGVFNKEEHGCALFLGEVRRYDGSHQELLVEAYAAQDVRGYPLQVIFLEENRIPNGTDGPLPAPMGDLAWWGLPKDVDQGSLYMVTLLVLDDEDILKLNCP